MTHAPKKVESDRRRLKRQVREALAAEDFRHALDVLLALPLRSLTSPLISCLASGDDSVKWHAIEALGAVTARLAEEDLDAARETLRRLNWSVTEEAGSIGWGAPEAIGEILANHEGLAEEFAGILLSYIHPINLLDHPPLLRGALWGIRRLAQANAAPLLWRGAGGVLKLHLDSEDAEASELARQAIESLDR